MIPKSGIIYTYELTEVTVSFDATPLSLNNIPLNEEILTVYEGDNLNTPKILPTETISYPAIPQINADLNSANKTEDQQINPFIPQFKPVTVPKTVPKAVKMTSNGRFRVKSIVAAGLIAVSAIGLLVPTIPKITFETSYLISQRQRQAAIEKQLQKPMPTSIPLTFNPLVGPDGNIITPINTDFSIVIPKVGINAKVIAGVDALNVKEYSKALKQGVAHAKSSYLPDQDGATYLFSHSTNYEWFVKDLNAVFYNVKNLEKDDVIVVFYKGKRFTYRFNNSIIVPPKDTSYLLPVTGKRMLILQTCWPPGTLQNRLLLFADLIEEKSEEI